MPQISPTNKVPTLHIDKVKALTGRNLFVRNKRIPAKDLSSEEIYERKKQQRLERARAIEQTIELSNFIQWIVEIQTKLNLTNAQFAQRLNVSSQSVKLWKRRSGHFPSRRTFLRLLELELESRVPVKVIRIRYGVRM